MNTSGLLQSQHEAEGLHLLCKRPEVFMIPGTFQKSDLFLNYQNNKPTLGMANAGAVGKSIGSMAASANPATNHFILNNHG